MPDEPRRAALIALAQELRPELHRYGARLMGSIIDGEDVVQDAFAQAIEAIDEGVDIPAIRPWLFRIAHNRALDLLRRRTVRSAESLETIDEIVDAASVEPLEALLRKEAIETAIERFVELPIVPRSVVILKDVLDLSLQDISDMLNLTVNAVKAHLARARNRLKAVNAAASRKPSARLPSPNAARFVALFNAGDWEGLRALLRDEARLVQSTHPPRAGAAEVGKFFSLYGQIGTVSIAPAWLHDREVFAVWNAVGSIAPDYFMWLEWQGDRIALIHDYRYVRYVMESAPIVMAAKPGP